MRRADLRRRRKALTSAWESFTGHEAPERGSEVRAEVAASWRRSAEALPASVSAAPVDADDVARSAWAESPLRSALPAVEEEVRSTAVDLDFVGALTDDTGRILWTVGGRTMRGKAEQVNFVPGGHWDESSVGTNALDLALRTRSPSTVYSAEHFSAAVHGWVCYAAPVTHPVTGDVLGVLDLSSTWDRAHPMALATVTAMARAIGAELGRLAPSMPAPRSGARGATDGVPGAPAADAPVRLRLLGAGAAECGGMPLLLPRRQLEVLALLALHPQGQTLDQLHAHLYGDAAVSPTTLKAEVSHLRRALGGGIASRPYRLERAVESDAAAVLAAVRDGRVADAARLYTGELLPWSSSPVLTDWRHHVDVAVRTAVAGSRDPDAAVALAETLRDDEAVLHQAWVLLPAGDPRRALVAGWLAAAESP